MYANLFASLAISFLPGHASMSGSCHEAYMSGLQVVQPRPGRQLRSLCGSQTRLQVLTIPIHQERLFLCLIGIFLYLGHMPQSG